MIYTLRLLKIKVINFFSNHWFKILAVCSISLFIGVCESCRTTTTWTQFLDDFDKSRLENSKDIVIATYALCVRSTNEKGTSAGQNIRDCQPILQRILDKDELKTCYASGRLAKQCYELIYHRQRDFLNN